jgi:hypothetical protein
VSLNGTSLRGEAALRDAMPPGSLYLIEGTAEDSATELLTGGAGTVAVSKAAPR